jgi:hypothetical protein
VGVGWGGAAALDAAVGGGDLHSTLAVLQEACQPRWLPPAPPPSVHPGPAHQGSHAVLAVSWVEVPASHARQLACPHSGWYVLAAQGWQAP